MRDRVCAACRRAIDIAAQELTALAETIGVAEIVTLRVQQEAIRPTIWLYLADKHATTNAFIFPIPGRQHRLRRFLTSTGGRTAA